MAGRRRPFSGIGPVRARPEPCRNKGGNNNCRAGMTCSGTSDQVWREQIAVKDRSIQGANGT